MHTSQTALLPDPVSDATGLIIERPLVVDDLGASRTVIVKRVLPGRNNLVPGYESAADQLAWETAIYRFLMRCRADFSAFPALYQASPGTLMLQNLETDHLVFTDEVQAQTALLDCFARLHAATAGKEAEYNALLREAGLELQNEEGKPVRQYEQHLATGCQFLSEHATEFGLAASELERDLERADDVLRSSSPFRCLIHGDYHSPKQSVVIEREFHLLDFGPAEYAHGLLDLARFPLGHVVYDHEANIWHRFSLNVVDGFATIYRRRLENHLGCRVDDQLWALHYAAAMLTTALDLIGDLLEQPERVRQHGLPLEAGRLFQADFLEILEVTAKALEAVDAFSASYELFRKLTTKEEITS